MQLRCPGAPCLCHAGAALCSCNCMQCTHSISIQGISQLCNAAQLHNSVAAKRTFVAAAQGGGCPRAAWYSVSSRTCSEARSRRLCSITGSGCVACRQAASRCCACSRHGTAHQRVGRQLTIAVHPLCTSEHSSQQARKDMLCATSVCELAAAHHCVAQSKKIPFRW